MIYAQPPKIERERELSILTHSLSLQKPKLIHAQKCDDDEIEIQWKKSMVLLMWDGTGYIPVTGYLIAFVGSGPGKSFLLVFRQPVASECMFIRRRGQ